MRTGQILRNYFKTIVWAVLMLYMLFSPANALPKTGFFYIPHFDKIVHFGMFAILVFLFRVESERNAPEKHLMRNIFIVLGLLFAALSEVIQYNFIAGRSGNIYDFIADAAGFIVGTAFYVFLWKKFTSRFVFLQRL